MTQGNPASLADQPSPYSPLISARPIWRSVAVMYGVNVSRPSAAPAEQSASTISPRHHRRQHLNGSHHSSIFMFENMAVKHEGANNRWVPKVHSELHTWIGTSTVPIGQVNRIPLRWVADWASIPGQHFEVDLMDVENMIFASSVLDHPVFDISLVHHDSGRGTH